MIEGDFTYHAIEEYFGFVVSISVDALSERVYYGVLGLDGKYKGSYLSTNFLPASRC